MSKRRVASVGTHEKERAGVKVTYNPALWLKSCPKCKADLVWQDGMDGWEMACLQCGHRLTDHQQEAISAAIRLTRQVMAATVERVA